MAAPIMGALALAAIPVVVVYFLKLRRPRQTVPSLVLWQRVMEDQRVNSPFQKFKKNLLLWLQLALLALIVLACMQPLISGGDAAGESVPIIVDCSASMGAVGEDGVSRLDEVKRELREKIDALVGDRQLSIVAAGPRAVRLCEFTSNPTILENAVDRLRTYAAPTNLDEALRLTEGMTIAGDIENVRLYSDGNLPVLPDANPDVATIPFNLPFNVDFQKIGQPVPNVGIVEASAQRSGSGVWDVFLRIAAGVDAGRADLVLSQDGEPLEPETVVLDAEQSQRLTFKVESTGRTALVAELQPKQFDALAADNRVRLDLPPSRNLRVRVGPGLSAFSYALKGFESIKIVETGADLAIVRSEDQLRDEPAAVVVGAIPAQLSELVELRDGHHDVIDWQRSDPLLQHVRMSGVLFSQTPRYRTGVGRKAIEEAGYRVVAEVEGGPLIVRKQEGRTVRYDLLFDPSGSTMTYRVGFPVMVANAVDIGFRQAELSAVRGQQAGVMPPIVVEQPGTYNVTGPSYEESFDVDSDRVIRGIVADELGDYAITRNGEPVRSFGVNLLDPTESSLRGVAEIVFDDVGVAASDREPSIERPLWRWLAMAALGILALEWWYFHRPVIAPTR